MEDSVRRIFSTLIKVPIIILVSYLIFNIFAFTLSYFKLLGISYVVMQTAVENNYIPDAEMETLTKYVQSLSTSVLENAEIIAINNTRKQYGDEITVGVAARYKFIMPIFKDKELVMDIPDHEINEDANIVITYTVPGLQYYPDLD